MGMYQYQEASALGNSLAASQTFNFTELPYDSTIPGLGIDIYPREMKRYPPTKT